MGTEVMGQEGENREIPERSGSVRFSGEETAPPAIGAEFTVSHTA